MVTRLMPSTSSNVLEEPPFDESPTADARASMSDGFDFMREAFAEERRIPYMESLESESESSARMLDMESLEPLRISTMSLIVDVESVPVVADVEVVVEPDERLLMRLLRMEDVALTLDMAYPPYTPSIGSSDPKPKIVRAHLT
jgi:hypothetical protein